MPANARDRRLDRVPQFDEKSRAYPVRALLSTQTTPRSYTWGLDTTLDQGQEGACVGFAWSHEMRAKPKVVAGITDASALALYGLARRLDEWPGEDYEGTSVLAGAKAVQAQGRMPEYRWAFGVEDLAVAVSRIGPAVLGINWHEGMYDPVRISATDGYRLDVTGPVVGGHAILCRAYSVRRRAFLLHNSWGLSWGFYGTAWVGYDDMARLLADDGEACIPIRR